MADDETPAGLPPRVEAIRQKYLSRLSESVVDPLRSELEAYRSRLLRELHALEESSDPLIAEDSKIAGMILESRLHRADLMDRLVEEYRREFEALGLGMGTSGTDRAETEV